MRPKLWNGPHPVGEALVRGLEMTGSPFLSAHTADGCVAGVMDGKGEVKFSGGEALLVSWYGNEGSSVRMPPPYESFWALDGIRSDTLGATPLANGYYLLATEQYLGALVMSGLDPIPNGYGSFAVTTGENPGYYSTETGLWFAKLLWIGSGARYLRAAVLDVGRLAVAKRYEYIEDIDNELRPKAPGWTAPQKSRIHVSNQQLIGGSEGSVVGQVQMYDLKALTNQVFDQTVSFPLAYTSNYVVGARYMSGAWYVLTQTPVKGELFKMVGGAVVDSVTTRAQYSWTIAAADGRVVIGGWSGVTHIMEVFNANLDPVGARGLGEDAFFIDVTCSKTHIAALTWSSGAGDLPYVLKTYERADIEDPSISELQPPTTVGSLGSRAPTGDPLDDAFYLPSAAQYVGRHLVVAYSGSYFSATDGPEDTGEVFVEVLSRDASKLRKTIALDIANTDTGVPRSASAGLYRM